MLFLRKYRDKLSAFSTTYAGCLNYKLLPRYKLYPVLQVQTYRASGTRTIARDCKVYASLLPVEMIYKINIALTKQLSNYQLEDM